MKYVIGIDLGTSAVKILLINQEGKVCKEVKKSYPLIQVKSGYSEQDPEEWIKQTTKGLAELVRDCPCEISHIEGISFAGQMEGLVLLDKNHNVLRNAILWNDSRTANQVEEIYELVGKERVLEITKNLPMIGLTLPNLLWVKEHEPENYKKVKTFLLPKDYLRFRMVGAIHSEYSDASATLMLNVREKKWSNEILNLLNINPHICPPLVESHHCVGTISKEFSTKTGLLKTTRVFAGGADNACGAVGSGILSEGETLCSIGTSGVIVSFEKTANKDFQGKVNYFHHAKEDSYFIMGAALSAGYSLSWFKSLMAKDEEFDAFLAGIAEVPIGSNGLLFTPYLVGERTPYLDSTIRGSFIGLDSTHNKADFARAVIEGVTFALCESVEVLRESGKVIPSIISIGGGSKNETWLQIQADIFEAKVMKLDNEQGPGMGAAMLAAYGCGWFSTLEDCSERFIRVEKTYTPIQENVLRYKELFAIYKEIYKQTKSINERLQVFRK